ncbi:hypothetical protein MJO28_007726, partial [Puccinia striiformis f. sp. tritici]
MKHLFKYICKGVDSTSMKITNGDETQKFIDGQYIGPSRVPDEWLISKGSGISPPLKPPTYFFS